MNRSIPSWCRTAVAIWVAAPLVAQDPDRLQWLSSLEVRAQGVYSAEKVRGELLTCPRLMLALWRPPADQAVTKEGLARVAGDLVREGLDLSGCPAGTVVAAVTAGHIVLEVDSGPVFRCGEVRLEGAESVDASDLAALLRGESGRWPGWANGVPAPCGDSSRTYVEQAVRRAYAARGRHCPDFAVDFRRSANLVDLVVVVESEGPELRIASIELVGEGEAEAAEVLDSLAVPADALEERLSALGRYTSITLPDFRQFRSGRLDPMRIDVRSAWYAKRAEVEAESGVAQLRRGLRWVESRLQQGASLRVSVDDVGNSTTGPIEVAGFDAWLGRGGAVIWVPAYRWAGGDSGPACFWVIENEVGIWCGGPTYARCDIGALKGAIGIFTEPTATGEMALRFGTSIGTQGFLDKMGLGRGDRLQVVVHPLTAGYTLRDGADLLRWDGTDLVSTAESSSVRIGADGAVSGELAFDRDGGEYRLSLLTETLDEILAGRREEFAAAEPVPIGEFVGKALFGVITRRLPPAGSAMVGAFGDVMMEPVERLSRRMQSGEADVDDGFRIPLDTQSSGFVLPAVLFRAALECPEGSWLRRVLLIGVDLGRGSARGGFELQRLHTRPEMGPLALSLTAGWLASMGRGGYAAAHAAAGAERCDLEAAAADLEALMESVDAGSPERVGAKWRALPDLADRMDGLEPGSAGDRVAWRRGLQFLWDAGLGDELRLLLESMR